MVVTSWEGETGRFVFLLQCSACVWLGVKSYGDCWTESWWQVGRKKQVGLSFCCSVLPLCGWVSWLTFTSSGFVDVIVLYVLWLQFCWCYCVVCFMTAVLLVLLCCMFFYCSFVGVVVLYVLWLQFCWCYYVVCFLTAVLLVLLSCMFCDCSFVGEGLLLNVNNCTLCVGSLCHSGFISWLHIAFR